MNRPFDAAIQDYNDRGMASHQKGEFDMACLR